MPEKDVPMTPEEKAELDRLAFKVLEEGPQPEKNKTPGSDATADADIARLTAVARGVRTKFETDPAYRVQVGQDQLARKAARDASDAGLPKKE